LGKLAASTHPENTGQSRVRPLLVTLSSELEQINVLQNAKKLHASEFNNIYIRKWLTKEERDAENDLRNKCKKVNECKGPMADGKFPFVVINGRIRERTNNGRINYKKSIDLIV
jgi:hypothetical protein